MMEIQHKKILRKLDSAKDRKGYSKILTEHQMAPSDYFVKSTYTDESDDIINPSLISKFAETCNLW